MRPAIKLGGVNFNQDDDQLPMASFDAAPGHGAPPFEIGQQTVLLYGEEISPSVLSHASGGQGGGAGPTSGDTGSIAGAASSGLVINVSYDSSVANAPAAFKTVVGDVVQYFQTHFFDPVTVNIAVGFGEVGGSRLPSGALGASSTYLTSVSYSALTSALAGDAKTSADGSSVTSLPATDPTGGHYWVSTAEGKALGLLGPSTSIDGYVGFGNTAGIFDYNNSDGVTAGSYDFYGVVAHEFSEVMGRILLVGASIGGLSNSYDPFDLFHYSSPGVHDFSGTTPGYFSTDGGVTNINSFNTIVGGDPGDWAGGTIDAYNAYGTPGVVEPISTGDQTALDVIGWDAVAPTPLPDLTVSNLALTFASGGGYTINFSINNVGTLGAGQSSTTGVYLSTDATITTGDTLLSAATTPDLSAGNSDNESASLAALPAGTYYVGVIADSAKLIGEASETNNTASLKVTVGGPGNDTITSSVGADILIGGGGADHFVYQSKNAGLDQILDFTQGTDKLDFASSVFGKHLAQGNANTGTLDASHFVANGTGPTNALQVFWFDTNHSTLNYDANGSNGAAPVPIAHLLGVATLTSDDIHLI